MARLFDPKQLVNTARRLQTLREPARALRSSRRTPLGQIRSASSSRYYSDPHEKKGIKIVHLFTALAAVGITATSYGLYQFYSSYTGFPSAVRTHLRAALRSASSQDYPRASRAFDQAYALALELAAQGKEGGMGTPEESLMKTTGIAIKHGGMWEDIGEKGKAIDCYSQGWKEVCDALALERTTEEGAVGGRKLSSQEIMRGVSIAFKMGDICVESGGKSGDKEAEKYYVWCVEEMLRSTMNESQKTRVEEEMQHGGVGPDAPKSETAKQDGLELPEWLGKVELAGGLERLGELYSRGNKPEYAQPLLLQAISILLPPPPKDGKKLPDPPLRIRCHAATLMNNLSSSLVSSPKPSADAINQAARWARQAITVSTQCRREGDSKRGKEVVPLLEREEGECEMVTVVGSYNLGALSELAGDANSAKQWYERSSVQSRRLGIKDEALVHLRRLEKELIKSS